jgi:hypothetical protein
MNESEDSIKKYSNNNRRDFQNFGFSLTKVSRKSREILRMKNFILIEFSKKNAISYY